MTNHSLQQLHRMMPTPSREHGRTRAGRSAAARSDRRLGTVRFRPRDRINRLAFTPDGNRLVTHGDEGASVLDAATGKELRHLASERRVRPGYGDLSLDGKLLAMWGQTPNVPRQDPCPLEFWDVESGKKIGSGQVEFNVKPIDGRPIRFSPDGKLLATSSINTDVHIWDVTTRKVLRSWQAHPEGVWTIAFSPDSRQLITCGPPGEFRLWDVATGQKLMEFKPLAWSGMAPELEQAFAPTASSLP